MAIRSTRSMVEEAERLIDAFDPAENLLSREDLVFVDLRDVRELQREGMIEGAFHCPRGMLEFWIDPQSPYHKTIFDTPDTTFVFYCASGWRSALATKTAVEMGLTNVAHIRGGFGAWREKGLSVKQAPRP